jgi:hypothetical protein
MLKIARHFYAFATLIMAISATGCLSIGGKVVNEDPETRSRIEALESRVSALEGTGARFSPPPMPSVN